MAHLLIFDSAATTDADGDPIDGSFGAPGGGVLTAAALHTKPARIYGAPNGDIEKIGFEFWIQSNATFTLSWYMEFFSDAPVNYPLPINHVAPGVSPTAQWAREQTEEVAGSGVVNHYNVVRAINAAGGAAVDVRYFPMIVHGLFVRLAVYAAAAPIAGLNLRIYAVVGGVDQQTTNEAKTAPWTNS